MDRRVFLTSMAGAPAILRAARTAGDKPNLLFLWTDQQRADTMAAYGNTTFRVPAMNRLASESVVFERAYVTQPVCTPSRSSMMTGTWPHQNGCVRNNIALTARTPTVPELLNDSSYRTGYMGKWHLGDEIFAQRGFQEWRAIEDGIYESYYSEGRDKNARSHYHGFLKQHGYQPEARNVFSRGLATKLPVEHSKPSFLANEASKFILQNQAEPWMLYVNFLEPHTPFASALNDLHSAAEAPLKNHPGLPPSDREPLHYQRRRAQQLKRDREAGVALTEPGGFQRLARNYAGLCSLVDQAIHRILWALEASGQAENTVVVYTSDHGEMMGAHQLLYKQVMYQESTCVPFLLRAPFAKIRPQRVAAPVSHIETASMVLDLLGKKDHGENHLAHLRGAKRGEDHVFLEWTSEGQDQGPNARTVVSPDGWKLVLHDTDRSMLFHLRADPQEMNNLYGRPEGAAAQKRLRAKIADWQKRTGDKLVLPEK